MEAALNASVTTKKKEDSNEESKKTHSAGNSLDLGTGREYHKLCSRDKHLCKTDR